MSAQFNLGLARLPKNLGVFLILLTIFHCPFSLAAQDAVVVVDRAVIYADEKMTSPIGFVRSGKRIKVGNKAKNNGMVYALVVSKKIAYIKVEDVSTAKESVESDRLTAERFQKTSGHTFKSSTSVLGYMYSSQISLDHKNDELDDKDAVTWMGFSIKGSVKTNRSMDLDLMLNYMTAKEGDEEFRAVELGGGGSFRIFEKNRFITKLYGHVLVVPYASYALGSLFRVNGRGYGLGGGANLSYRLTNNWGLEAFGGIYWMKLLGFSAPATYDEIEPSFIGNRFGLGINYQF